MSGPLPPSTEGDDAAPAPRPEPRAGRFTLARIGGLEVEGHVLLLPLLVLVGFLLATELLPDQEAGAYGALEYWLMGGLGALLLMASVLAHELAHALTSRAHGLRIERVSVFFHGQRPGDQHDGRTPGAEFLIAGVGPATSIALGGLAWAAAELAPEIRLVSPLLRFGGIVNLLLGLASLIPAFPLDGGRMVRALAWQLTGTRLQGTRYACLAGRALAALLFAVGIALALRGGLGPSALWAMALALIVHVQAGATWRTARVRDGLAGLTVGDLLRPLPPTLPRQVSVHEALFSPDFAGLRDGARAFLVEFHGRLGGVATLRALRRVPEALRAATPVWEITTRLRHEHLLTPSFPAEPALARLAAAGLPLLPVLDGPRLAGVFTREAAEAAIEARVAGGNPQPAGP